MIYNPSSTSTFQNLDFSSPQTCWYRLPCGYCQLLGYMCPNPSYNTPVYKTEVTNNTDLNKISDISEIIKR